MAAIRQYAQSTDMVSIFGAFDARVDPQSMNTALVFATGYVENQTRRILSSGTYTETNPLVVSRDLEVVLKVKNWPITAVSAITWHYTDVHASRVVHTVTDFTLVDFEQPPARLVFYAAPSVTRYRSGRSSITYTGGFVTMPQDIILATCLVAQEVLMRQINPFGSTSISVSAGPSSNSLSLGMRSLNLTLADQILMPYQAWE